MTDNCEEAGDHESQWLGELTPIIDAISGRVSR